MKKSIFLFFAAILCAMTMQARNVTKPRIYYDNSNTSYSSVAFVVGHSNYSRCYKLTQISNTNLWYRYLNGTGNDSWTDATQIAVFGVDWDSSEGSSIANRRNYTGDKYTNTLTLSSDLSSGKVYLVTASGNKSTTSIALKSGGYTDLNYTQTVQQQLTTDGTTYNVSTEAIATVSVTSYKLSDYSTTASNSGTIASGSSSAECEAARTATVTYSVTGVNSAYTFVGWYDGDTQKSTSSTYTYQATEAKTITARFAVATEEEHEVTITYVCGSNTVSDATSAYVGVETEKSFTAPTVTGYNFTGWTKGAGIVEKSSNENTITIVTKTGETDYTLVANYEVVNETIYFINAGKWADVYIHLWNGTATGTSWPGTQLTATGTKIGEYDVYEYTAQQGAHANVLFHKKDNGSQQTADLTWSEGVNKYYIHNHNGKTGWYTQAEAEEILVVPVVEETVYFVNNKNWTKVQVHAWKDAANNGWPGQALTATGNQVAGFDVYSFTAPQGTYTNLLFNNKEGDAGVQSNNFVWTADKYYYMDAAADYAGGTKEEVAVLVAPDPLATGVYLAGDMTNKDNWDVNKKEFKKETAEATTASVTVTLAAQTYKFKLVVGGAWKGNTGTMQRGGDAVHEGGWSFDKDGYDDNCQIVADIAGDYIFTWDLTTKKLTVTYPALPAVDAYNVTVPAGTLECYISGSFDSWASFHKMTKVDETHYTISIPGANTGHTYKYASGPSWDFEEVTATDGHVESRTYTAADEVAKWKAVYDPDAVPQELVYNVEVPAGTTTCYIAMDTDPAQDGWEFTEMTKVDDTHYTLTRTGLKTDSYKYACQPNWDYAEKTAEGNDVANRTWAANDVVAKWGAPAPAEPVITYVLMGVNGDWTTGIALTKNPGNEDEYVLENQVVIKATDAVKVVTLTNGTATAWCGDVDSWSNATYTADADGNIVLEDGIYTFYFKKTANNIYINQTGYARNVTNKYGTICLPYASASTTGATFYRVAGKETGKVYLESVDALEAGVPYIFEKTANQIKVVYTGEKETTAGTDNGLVGTFTNETVVANGDYILYNNQFCPSDGTAKVNAYRAYLDMEDIVGGQPTQMPGRRYIGMAVTGENEATGFDNIVAPEKQVIKAIINGQLVIIRGGEMFNAQGVRL